VGLIAAAVVVVAALAAGGVFWRLRHSASPEAPAASDQTPADAALASSSPADGAAAGATPPSGGAPSASPAAPATPPPAPVAVAPPAATPPPAAGPGRSGTTGDVAAATDTPAVPARGTTPAAAGARGTSPAARGPIDDTQAAFTDVRQFVVVGGKKTRDEDVLVSFVGGQISLLREKDSSSIASWPYRSVLGATYVKARDPRWDPALAAPPDDVDVGGILRTSKHWLVLQNRDAYLMLRLSDSNYARVLEVLETRTGITVARPNPDADKK
jgi:hypothetical protein